MKYWQMPDYTSACNKASVTDWIRDSTVAYLHAMKEIIRTSNGSDVSVDFNVKHFGYGMHMLLYRHTSATATYFPPIHGNGEAIEQLT